MMAVVTRWGHTSIYATLCEWGMKRLCLARPDQIGKAIRVIVVNMFIRSFVRSFVHSFIRLSFTFTVWVGPRETVQCPMQSNEYEAWWHRACKAACNQPTERTGQVIMGQFSVRPLAARCVAKTPTKIEH